MTLIPWLLAVVPLLGLPRAAGSVTVSDSSALYVRDNFRFQGATLSIENAPRIDLDVGFRALRLSLGYGPRIVGAGVGGADSPSLLVMHEGSASLRYERRRTQLAAGHALSIGELFLGKLPTAPAPDAIAPPDPTTSRATPLANAQSLRIRAHTTSAIGSYRWTRRAQSELAASYGLSGGADAASRALQPSMRTLAFSSALRFLQTPRALLVTSGGASRVATSNDYQHWIATVSQTLSYRATRVTSTSLTVGAAFRNTQDPEDDVERGLVPIAGGSLDRRLKLGRGLGSLQAGVSLSPFVNMLTGELQTALQGTSSAGLQRKRASAALTLDALQTLPVDASRATRVIGGGVRGSRRVAEWLDLFLGLRLQHQRIEDTALSLSLQWAVSAGCVIATPPRLF